MINFCASCASYINFVNVHMLMQHQPIWFEISGEIICYAISLLVFEPSKGLYSKNIVDQTNVVTTTDCNQVVIDAQLPFTTFILHKLLCCTMKLHLYNLYNLCNQGLIWTPMIVIGASGQLKVGTATLTKLVLHERSWCTLCT